MTTRVGIIKFDSSIFFSYLLYSICNFNFKVSSKLSYRTC